MVLENNEPLIPMDKRSVNISFYINVSGVL